MYMYINFLLLKHGVHWIYRLFQHSKDLHFAEFHMNLSTKAVILPTGVACWSFNGDAGCFLWGTNWISTIVYIIQVNFMLQRVGALLCWSGIIKYTSNLISTMSKINEDCFSLEEFYLLGYNGMYSVETQPTFRRNMWPLSSGSQKKPNKKATCSACYLLHVGFVLGLFFYPEDWSDMFLRNVCSISTSVNC
jgi:hypothetical protein